MVHPRITVVHDLDLDEIDRSFIDETLLRTLTKMDRLLKNEHRLKAVYKQIQKEGLRHKTEVSLSLDGPGKAFHSQSSDWKVRLATTEACTILEREIMRHSQQ
ncbi:MAG: hypothetical protein V1776_00425 [Candidatus Diapherotrites archaeon]